MWNKVIAILVQYVMGQVVLPALTRIFNRGKTMIKKIKIRKGVKDLEKALDEKDFNNSFDNLD